MKTIWFVGILSVLIVLPINAQLKSGLYVDSYSGSAQLKVRGSKNWTKPAHKQSIMRLDSVRVPEKSKMTVVDAVNGNVYPCEVSFYGSVNQFIQQAKKSQSKSLVELVKQLELMLSEKTDKRPIMSMEEQRARRRTITIMILLLALPLLPLVLNSHIILISNSVQYGRTE